MKVEDFEMALKHMHRDASRVMPDNYRRLCEGIKRNAFSLMKALEADSENVARRLKPPEWDDAPEEIRPTKPVAKTYAIDHKGNLWHWNMGWYLSDTKGQPVDWNRPRLGHVKFRKSIKLYNPTTMDAKEVLLGKDRPGCQWRRWVVGIRYDHVLYGVVTVLATDGVRAIVRETDGMKLDVMFKNLTEIKPINPPTGKKARRVGKKKKKSKEIKKQFTIEELL